MQGFCKPQKRVRFFLGAHFLFMDNYRNFIFYRTYSRWSDELGRRETWQETVQRYVDYMLIKLDGKLSEKDCKEIYTYIYEQKVMPSMRLLWSAGKACDRSNVTAYNCSYISPTKLRDFGEILYLLTCGCGVGFSVERRVIDQLPVVRKMNGITSDYVVKDDKEGWANALVHGMKQWYNGKDVTFDYTKIRPAGARLMTMGGRASGAAPLKGLLEFTKEKILSRQEMRLRPIDVHDIICKIGDVVVSGGVRRSSEISLSDLDDEEMRNAKVGAFYEREPQRTMSNNSAVYNEKPTAPQFMREWLALMESGTGERGIFNRGGLEKQMPQRRWEESAEYISTMGTNPCGEIYLRSRQFCNLTEVIAREDDTRETLLDKIRIATIIGTYQSSLTDFGYLSDEWKRNSEEEALLGVSVTGQMDCPALHSRVSSSVWEEMKELAIETNKKYAKKLGINQSASVTCVKPSGTVSQLVNASSGMHPRFSQYYIRRVRISATDPLFKMLKDQGVPYNPEVGQEVGETTTYVLEFPIKSPRFVNNMTAIEQLEHWAMVKVYYTEHNPSNTIYIDDNEWLEVANWIWKNWDIVGGLSFLPRQKHVYQLSPYEKIDKQQYDELVKKFPDIDFSLLTKYENEDNTEGAKSLSCSGDTCEII